MRLPVLFPASCNQGSLSSLLDILALDHSRKEVIELVHDGLRVWDEAINFSLEPKRQGKPTFVTSAPVMPGMSLSATASSAMTTSYPFWWASRAVVLTQT